ncbi:MAG: UDP-glucose 4-epimerase GalE [Chitinophagaceae bacterium]
MKKTILVTGGGGYIGTHTLVDLIENGYDVICVDNFSRSHPRMLKHVEQICGVSIPLIEIDLCQLDAVQQLFEQYSIDGIIHFAAFKSVPESVENPLFYYRNNIDSLLNLLACVKKHQISFFVFSSSCSVYGNVTELPVTESVALSKPESPYAATKQMGEQILRDFSKSDACNIILLRYFNPVGAHPSALIGELPVGKPNNLVPVITQTAVGIIDKMYVWGSDYATRDGSGIRDYIHVCDVAHAHTLALDYLVQKKNSEALEIFNLGIGEGVSVLEAIHSFEKVSGVKLNYEIGPRRAGDVEAVYANNDKAKSLLAWSPKYSLDDMMRTAWAWQQGLQGFLGKQD